MQVVVRHLFISPGHNFFGHHGQPAGLNPTQEVSEVMCRAGRGIEGDRFFDYKPDYRGQITFFDHQVYVELKRRFSLPDLKPGAFRRNVMVEGLDLMAHVGVRFNLGAVEFEGMCESAPCYWMDQAACPGAEQWLKGRGGLRARILRDGALRVGANAFAVTSGHLSRA
ncbi:MAG: molybdenum cofactor biosysynthesis protein [Opitutaceae bacterium]|nr:molybdenum cofactor biosysynthesis protein [Opitutaceae bacterium]